MREKVKVFRDYKSMCERTANEIIENLQSNPCQMLCIAAGHTSLGVFDALVQAFREKKVDFSRGYFIAMDEWMGMNQETEGSCGWFLVENFLSKVNYPKDHVFLWNGIDKDWKSECQKAKQFIENYSEHACIDYLVLGVGMNGHLALNEPGTKLSARAHKVQLDGTTALVGQKYFQKAAKLEEGITLGLADFQDAEKSVLLINGERKTEILTEILEAEGFVENIPATAVYAFPNGILYCDDQALGQERGGC